MQSAFENYIERSDKHLTKISNSDVDSKQSCSFLISSWYTKQIVVLKCNLFAQNYSEEIFTCLNEMFYYESA